MAQEANRQGTRQGGERVASSGNGDAAPPAERDPVPTPFSMSDEAVEAALASGEQSGLLEDYFGPAQYAELRRLAQEAAARSTRGGEKVLILPGIMGSKLGRGGGIFDDVIWADPIDIAAGRLRELTLAQDDRSIGAIGVILFAYLKLKYRLRIAGYDAGFHPYDWRRSVADLGRELAGRIVEKANGRTVHVVAHSMGGLVVRAAFADRPKGLGRVVMLGTPNHGSFAPLQAFRGTLSILRKLAFIDRNHSREDLARKIFRTFPGLYEMMPSPDKVAADYFSLSSWPSAGVLPDQGLLTAARRVQNELPADYDDLITICGINRETVTGAAVQDGEFVYTTSLDGDGTVPLPCALLANAGKTYFIEETHGSLPNNGLIARAVDSILATGETSLLAERPPSRREAPVRTVRERALEVPPYEGNEGRPLSVREQRFLLEEVAAPDKAPAPMADIEDAAATPPAVEAAPIFSDRIVIGRRRQHRLDMTLAFGSLTEVDASAYVLGLFRHVTPGGPARAVDRLLGGAIEQVLARRMFNANVGEISILPTGRHPIRADLIAFAGLGPFDGFREEVLEVVGENLVRTFLATRVDDFATVPIGGGSGALTLGALKHLLTGFFRGLRDADQDQHFRGITICETDSARFAAVRGELYRLCATPLFDGIEVTLRELDLPPPAVAPAARSIAPSAPQNVYLIVRQETRDGDDPIGLASSVLTAGAKAAIFKGRQEVDKAALDALLGEVETEAFDAGRLPDFGGRLGTLVLPDSIRVILERYAAHPLVVVHDAAASRIPWETVRIGDGFPAIQGGLSHRYEAEDLAIAKWLEQRQMGTTLDVLLVVNPTKDLPGAAEEGNRVKALFDALGRSVRLRELVGDQARKQELLRCFASGEFDVVHYAGHAFFDPLNPARSGIVCAGDEVLSGTDLAGVGSLPSLVFFNACEAARVRKRGERRDRALSVPERVRRNIGFAEAFLRGGIANYIGTYWPVGDAAALAFARSFYERLLAGCTLGEAIMTGRQAVHGIPSVDWADYILYGDPGFVLKQRP